MKFGSKAHTDALKEIRMAAEKRVTADTLTDEEIREVRDRVMGGSPLSEDTLVATGDCILDDGDPDDNIEMARERIADAINARAKERP